MARWAGRIGSRIADRIRPLPRCRRYGDLHAGQPGRLAAHGVALVRCTAASARDDAERCASAGLSRRGIGLARPSWDLTPIRSRAASTSCFPASSTARWREGKGLDLAALIRGIQTPPFDEVGVLDLESFFPAKERFGLAMQLNNLLASPDFAALDGGRAARHSAAAVTRPKESRGYRSCPSPTSAMPSGCFSSRSCSTKGVVGAPSAWHIEPAGDPLHG